MSYVLCFECGLEWLGCVMFVLLVSQVEFWSQYVSFFLVGVIVITSIRGLLITFTKVRTLSSMLYQQTLHDSTCVCATQSLFYYTV